MLNSAPVRKVFRNIYSGTSAEIFEKSTDTLAILYDFNTWIREICSKSAAFLFDVFHIYWFAILLINYRLLTHDQIDIASYRSSKFNRHIIP